MRTTGNSQTPNDTHCELKESGNGKSLDHHVAQNPEDSIKQQPKYWDNLVMNVQYLSKTKLIVASAFLLIIFFIAGVYSKDVFNKTFNQSIQAGPDSIDQLIEKAEQGDLTAQYEVVNKYIKGGINKEYVEGGNVQINYYEGYKWAKKYAEKGSSGSQNQLGWLYQNGFGVPKNDNEAVNWWRKSANQGSPDGQYLLGECYIYGIGIKKDTSGAIKWLTKASEQGHLLAQRVLVEIYQEKATKNMEYTGYIDSAYTFTVLGKASLDLSLMEEYGFFFMTDGRIDYLGHYGKSSTIQKTSSLVFNEQYEKLVPLFARPENQERKARAEKMAMDIWEKIEMRKSK